MKKSIAILLILAVIFSAFTSCRAGDEADGETGAAAPSPETRLDVVPAIFVNDTYFRIFADRRQNVPDLDDTWVYLGNIDSATPEWESPAENFQTNEESMMGAEIYRSFEGRIRIAAGTWGDPLDEEVIGDSIIADIEGTRSLYISEEAYSEVIKVMDAAVRQSLMVDGVVYSLMSVSGGESSSVPDSYIFLGEVMSAVPMREFPTENLQANRDSVVGAQVYRLPPGGNNDIVVFFTPVSRFYYKHLPETKTYL